MKKKDKSALEALGSIIITVGKIKEVAIVAPLILIADWLFPSRKKKKKKTK